MKNIPPTYTSRDKTNKTFSTFVAHSEVGIKDRFLTSDKYSSSSNINQACHEKSFEQTKLGDITKSDCIARPDHNLLTCNLAEVIRAPTRAVGKYLNWNPATLDIMDSLYGFHNRYDGKIFPSQKTLGNLSGHARETANRSIALLEWYGAIEKVYRHRRTCLYRITKKYLSYSVRSELAAYCKNAGLVLSVLFSGNFKSAVTPRELVNNDLVYIRAASWLAKKETAANKWEGYNEARVLGKSYNTRC